MDEILLLRGKALPDCLKNYRLIFVKKKSNIRLSIDKDYFKRKGATMEHFGRRLIGVFLSGVLFLIGIALSGDPLSGHASGTHSLFAPLITRQVDAKPNDYLAVALVGLLDDTEIYTFRADGTDVNRLTHNEWQERGPKFSPNGTQIAFWQYISTAGEIPALAQVKIMNVDGSGVRSVGRVLDATYYGGLYWTSDGKYLVADVIRSEEFAELTLIDVASGEDTYFLGRYYFWGLSPDERYLHRDYSGGTWIHDLTNPTAPPVALDIVNFSARLWHPYQSELFYGDSDEKGKRVMAIQPDGSNARLVSTGNYNLIGWLNNGRNALLVAPRDRYYTVPSEGGTVIPYGDSATPEVDFMAIAPHQDAILYATKTAIPSISVVYHPTTGSPIKLIECAMVNNLACMAGGADWAWDS